MPSATDPGIDKPWYGIGFFDAYRRFWKKYATFSGRASRGEYWWATLANYVISMVVIVIAVVIIESMTEPCSRYDTIHNSCPDQGSGFVPFVFLMYLYPLATLIPNIAIVWRRLHDSGRSGALYFLGFIPYAGGIVLMVLLAQRSLPEGARYDVPQYGTYGSYPYGPYGSPPPYGYPPYGP